MLRQSRLPISAVSDIISRLVWRCLIYDPATYWERRLTRRFNLRGVGNSAFSARYNKWLYRAKRRALEQSLGDVDLRMKHVLDVGAGTGFFIGWYIRRQAIVCGIDITRRAVESLKARYNADFRVQDVTAQDFELPLTFDVVNAWDVLYHIVEPAGFERALDNITRCLKRGGLILITDRFAADRDVREAEHVQFRCLASYERLLQPRGVQVKTVQFLYGRLNRSVIGPRADRWLAPAYYWLDGWARSPVHDNLSLAVLLRT